MIATQPARFATALACIAAAGSALAQQVDPALVATRRDGQTIYYRLVSRDVAPLIAKLYDMFCRA